MTTSRSFSFNGTHAVLTILLTCAASLARAQPPSAEPLGEITVTATMRELALIDVPASVSVLTPAIIGRGLDSSSASEMCRCGRVILHAGSGVTRGEKANIGSL